MSIDGRARSYGKIWGGWTIGKMLGQGSGGKTAVFKLSRTNLTFTEECAMKVINIVEEQLDYGEVTEDYRNFYNQRKNELRRMAEGEVNLMHQLKDCYNVVQYLDFDFNDWQEDDSFGTDLLIRMVLLGNLNTKMKKSSCTEDEIIQVGIDICTALEGCYAHNIIHRDIKPDNIFMNEHSYLLGDFGISRIIKNGMTAQTNTGTAHYAAPEQFKQTGLAVGYDYRVDIYSLGLTLYVLANKGRLPFTENLYNTQLAIQLRLSGKEFPMLEGVNFKLQEIIFKACSFKAEDRYKNATEMKKELIALKDNYVVGDNGGGYETEPALLIENSFETQPALSLTNTGFETESALSTENIYETQPALSATSVGYETEPVLSTPAQREEPKQEIYKAPALKMEKVETTIKDNSLKSEIEDAKSMDMQLSQPEAIDNLDYKVMAHDCIIRGDYNAALDAFLKAIEQGEWNAMYYEVKQMFSTDREIKKNAELAVFWYQNCITYGKDSWTVSLAEYQLGEIYAKGIGVKKDHKYAEELFSKSASKGNPYAKKKFVAGKYVK